MTMVIPMTLIYFEFAHIFQMFIRKKARRIRTNAKSAFLTI